MRKIAYLILLLGLFWLAKLSYDVAQYSQAFPQLQQQLAQSEQHYALLNDQLVAMQRQLQTPQTTEAVEPASTPQVQTLVTGITPTILIQQQLQLIQFALDQQQLTYALDHLNQLQQHIAQYTLSPALQHSLIQAIEQDKQNIQQFVLAQNQQQQQLDRLLQRFDQKLQQELQQPQPTMPKNDHGSWWHWFQLEKVKRAAPDLIQRHLILKEAQLRLLLASQALHKGQAAEYRQAVQEVKQLLTELPDQHSQQMQEQLEKILNFPVMPAPKLKTPGLLG